MIAPLGGGIFGFEPLFEPTSTESTKVLSGDQWSISVGMSLRSVCTTTWLHFDFDNEGWCFSLVLVRWQAYLPSAARRPPSSTIWRP